LWPGIIELPKGVDFQREKKSRITPENQNGLGVRGILITKTKGGEWVMGRQ